jgi:anti-sigma regulatory factor (Ser/Thr protein kinase)
VVSPKVVCGINDLWKSASGDPHAVLRLRHEFTKPISVHDGWDVDVDASQAIFGELIANVIEHAPGEIRVWLSCDNRELLLRVDDQGPLFSLKPCLPVTPLAESGRGLFIVTQYAESLTLKSNPPWKSLIASLPRKAA